MQKRNISLSSISIPESQKNQESKLQSKADCDFESQSDDIEVLENQPQYPKPGYTIENGLKDKDGISSIICKTLCFEQILANYMSDQENLIEKAAGDKKSKQDVERFTVAMTLAATDTDQARDLLAYVSKEAGQDHQALKTTNDPLSSWQPLLEGEFKGAKPGTETYDALWMAFRNLQSRRFGDYMRFQGTMARLQAKYLPQEARKSLQVYQDLSLVVKPQQGPTKNLGQERRKQVLWKTAIANLHKMARECSFESQTWEFMNGAASYLIHRSVEDETKYPCGWLKELLFFDERCDICYKPVESKEDLESHHGRFHQNPIRAEPMLELPWLPLMKGENRMKPRPKCPLCPLDDPKNDFGKTGENELALHLIVVHPDELPSIGMNANDLRTDLLVRLCKANSDLAARIDFEKNGGIDSRLYYRVNLMDELKVLGSDKKGLIDVLEKVTKAHRSLNNAGMVFQDPPKTQQIEQEKVQEKKPILQVPQEPLYPGAIYKRDLVLPAPAQPLSLNAVQFVGQESNKERFGTYEFYVLGKDNGELQEQFDYLGKRMEVIKAIKADSLARLPKEVLVTKKLLQKDDRLYVMHDRVGKPLSTLLKLDFEGDLQLPSGVPRNMVWLPMLKKAIEASEALAADGYCCNALDPANIFYDGASGEICLFTPFICATGEPHMCDQGQNQPEQGQKSKVEDEAIAAALCYYQLSLKAMGKYAFYDDCLKHEQSLKSHQPRRLLKRLKDQAQENGVLLTESEISATEAVLSKNGIIGLRAMLRVVTQRLEKLASKDGKLDLGTFWLFDFAADVEGNYCLVEQKLLDVEPAGQAKSIKAVRFEGAQDDGGQAESSETV